MESLSPRWVFLSVCGVKRGARLFVWSCHYISMSWGLYEDLAPPSKDLATATASVLTSASSGTATSQASNSLTGANPTSKVPPSLRPKKPLLTPRAAQVTKRIASDPKKQPSKKPKFEVASNASALPTISKEAIYNTHVNLDASDPYDPDKPNDYEDYLEEKKKAALVPPPSLISTSEREDSKYEPPKPSVAIPPPAVYHTSSEEEKKPQSKSEDDDDADGIPLSALSSNLLNTSGNQKEPKPSAGLSAAEKMMKNMGWKGSGHGLGSKGQGIPNPLMMIKTQSGTGIITVDRAVTPIESSTVVVLRNMTVKGQVDELLQPETAGECQKYGNVLECIVYEVPGDVSPEESVRIFVRFEHPEEALKGSGCNKRQTKRD